MSKIKKQRKHKTEFRYFATSKKNWNQIFMFLHSVNQGNNQKLTKTKKGTSNNLWMGILWLL